MIEIRIVPAMRQLAVVASLAMLSLVSFPGPAKLSVTCSTHAWRAWNEAILSLHHYHTLATSLELDLFPGLHNYYCLEYEIHAEILQVMRPWKPGAPPPSPLLVPGVQLARNACTVLEYN